MICREQQWNIPEERESLASYLTNGVWIFFRFAIPSVYKYQSFILYPVCGNNPFLFMCELKMSQMCSAHRWKYLYRRHSRWEKSVKTFPLMNFVFFCFNSFSAFSVICYRPVVLSMYFTPDWLFSVEIVFAVSTFEITVENILTRTNHLKDNWYQIIIYFGEPEYWCTFHFFSLFALFEGRPMMS